VRINTDGTPAQARNYAQERETPFLIGRPSPTLVERKKTGLRVMIYSDCFRPACFIS